ncbi:MAG TPA: hypothetical protein VFQ39_06170 [Longimicrobium sp.]|nr:hypothetical protein [Longimicrobium sp.]
MTTLRAARSPRAARIRPDASSAADHPPVAVAEPAPPPKPKRVRPGRRVRLVREVAGEVETLRDVLEEAVRAYEARIAAQLSEVLRALYAEHSAVPRLPSAKTTTAMLRAIRAVELKPARGRAKDLVRLHELVGELTELLTPDS